MLLSACGDDADQSANEAPPTPIVQPAKPAADKPAASEQPRKRKSGSTEAQSTQAQSTDKPQKRRSERNARSGEPLPQGKGFDFYVLALSWSPSYCEAEGEDANAQQCSRPYGMTVHGLWPQFERGWPQDCATTEPDVPRETLQSLYDIMPSSGLIRYEWRKHGTCTQMPQADYFRVLREAWNRVNIPAQFKNVSATVEMDANAIEGAFLSVNPAMKAAGTAVICDGRYFREVRICMARDLSFRACAEVDERACRLRDAEIPPVHPR
ncbi:MAG: ribonuclease [Rhizobiaceae bacterium]